MFDAFVVSTSATLPNPTCAFVVACGLLVLDVCDVSVERLAVICACNFPKATNTESVAEITAFVTNERPVNTTALTLAAVKYSFVPSLMSVVVNTTAPVFVFTDWTLP
jgi:hypothetical protein